MQLTRHKLVGDNPVYFFCKFLPRTTLGRLASSDLYLYLERNADEIHHENRLIYKYLRVYSYLYAKSYSRLRMQNRSMQRISSYGSNLLYFHADML
ncbi:hypothetical protein TNCT_634321 [Trichonephila clavata]|uniref:Uncharacterized protein n=1 Tax=Trichonephila clavata TaxID=2740835 RepID=A0A8X6H648_TRICU|nr:hypothetical protein TNCT_634321 [Trichonephila clavata]